MSWFNPLWYGSENFNMESGASCKTALTLSWWRLFSYRNQSIDLLLRKSMDWFLYDNDRHHERVKVARLHALIFNLISFQLDVLLTGNIMQTYNLGRYGYYWQSKYMDAHWRNSPLLFWRNSFWAFWLLQTLHGKIILRILIIFFLIS